MKNSKLKIQINIHSNWNVYDSLLNFCNFKYINTKTDSESYRNQLRKTLLNTWLIRHLIDFGDGLSKFSNCWSFTFTGDKLEVGIEQFYTTMNFNQVYSIHKLYIWDSIMTQIWKHWFARRCAWTVAVTVLLERWSQERWCWSVVSSFSFSDH